MAKKTGKKKQKKQANQTLNQNPGPWISMRVGIIVISITSVAMAVLTAYQAIPLKGVVDGILYGVFFGVMIWIIFFGFILINRFLRK